MCELEKTGRVSAYHDGEMAPEEQLAYERHLAGCGECRQALEELRRLSRAFGALQAPALGAEALQRLRRTASAATETVVVRLAERLAAAAAAILIASLGWAWISPAQTARTPATAVAWEWAAASAGAASATETTQIAQWIVDDLSLEKGHE